MHDLVFAYKHITTGGNNQVSCKTRSTLEQTSRALPIPCLFQVIIMGCEKAPEASLPVGVRRTAKHICWAANGELIAAVVEFESEQAWLVLQMGPIRCDCVYNNIYIYIYE